MKVKDYRIGNIAKYDDRVFRIHSIAEEFPTLDTDEFGIGVVDWNNLKPIKLTEEWLKKIGFEKINHIHGYSFYSLSKSKKNKCHIHIYDTTTKFMGYPVNHCNYVHELQNLYFAITGNELSIEIN